MRTMKALSKLFVVFLLVLGLSACKSSTKTKRVLKSVRKCYKVYKAGGFALKVYNEYYQCPTCNGYGFLVYVDENDEPIYVNGYLLTDDCYDCLGSGKRSDY